MFLLPVFMERIMGFDEIRTGLILLPAALLMAVLIPPSGRMADRIGPRWPSILGLLIITVFMYLYRTLNVNTSVWGLIYPTLIRSVGFVMLMAPVLTAALNSVPRSKAGMVSSISNIIQQVAGALGIALLTTVLGNRTHFHLNTMASVASVSPAAQGFLKDIAGLAVQHGYSHLAAGRVAGMLLARHVAETAQVAGFDDTFLFGAVLIILAVVPAFLLPKNVVILKEPEGEPKILE
jgi:MFS family permease